MAVGKSGLGWFGAGGDGWVNERADGGGVGNRPEKCCGSLKTPCCGVRYLVLPSKDIGSIGPPGLRIWLKITCDMCKNGSRRRKVQARRLLRDSRRAHVSCEGKWCI